MKALARWLVVAFWTLAAVGGWGVLIYAMAITGIGGMP